MKQGLVFAAASAAVCLVLSGCAGSGEEPLAVGASSESGSESPNATTSETGSGSPDATLSESAGTSPSDTPSQTASVPPPGGPTPQASPAPAPTPAPTATSELHNWRDSPSRYLYTYEDAYHMVTERGMTYYSAFCLNYSPVTPEGVAQCDGIVSGIISFISGDYIGPFRGPEYTDLKATTYPS